jgi:hypothetical protein
MPAGDAKAKTVAVTRFSGSVPPRETLAMD